MTTSDQSLRLSTAGSLRRWFAASLVILASLPALFAQSGNATIVGSVTNSATRAFLEGAQVSLVGTNHEALTGRDGQFELTGVDPGEYTLEVSYTGLDLQRKMISVQPGRNVVPMIGLTADIYLLDVFTVSGEREGSAAAITAQRFAPNVKSIVATDAFGHVVDGNIGEMLKRVSGVATNLNEGEVDQIFVRGVGSAFSAVTLDGTRLPSPAKGKKTRNFEVDKLPADYIESIEVIKAPTPDMDADSVGGAVNLITKSAFAIDGRRLSYNFGLNHKTLRSKNSFFGGIQYSDILGEKKNLGVYFSFGYSDNYVPQDVTQLDFEGAYNDPAYMYRFRLEDAVHLRNRTGAGLKLEYRLSENTNLFASFMYNHYTDEVDQKRLTIQTSQAANAFAPGYTDKRWEMLSGDYLWAVGLIEPKQETYALQTGAKHNLPGLKIDYSASYAPATGSENRQNFDTRLRRQRMVIDRTRDVWYPTYEVLTAGDPDDYNRYDRLRMGSESGETKEAVWGAEFNVNKEFDTNVPLSLKFGARYRGQMTEVDEDTINSTYIGTDKERFKLQNYSHSGFDGRYSGAAWPDVKAAYASFLNEPTLWDLDLVATTEDELANDGKVREDVYATYVMGTADIGKLRVLAGVRMEKTDVEGTGVLYEPLDTPLPSGATEQQQADRVREEYHKVTKESSYTQYFPGLHLRYELKKSLLLRGSYATSLARPNFGDLMPDTSINHEDFEISQNNTGLKPQRANNFDLSLEYYYEPSGMISVGAFYKSISDFIFNDNYVIGTGPNNGFNGQYENYEFSTKKNGGEATVQGVEFSFNQQLTFLPDWARGFSLYATYTLIDSEGNYNSQGAQSDDQLVQFVPETWNIGLTYQNYGWTVRAQLNYNDRFLNGYNNNPAARIYDDERVDGELRVKYQFNRKLALFCDWTNALDQTVVRVQGKDLYRPQKIRYNGMRLNMGVSGTF